MTSMNFEQARFNMVEQQVRTWDVLNPRVLSVLHETPREKFVPESHQNFAYTDTNIPLSSDQSMMKPVLEARLLQALDIQEHEVVLEVGTGSGYLTALMAQLGKAVYSVDINNEFVEAAKQRLAEFGLTNVTVEQGDAVDGWNRHGPFDVIACSASFPVDVPEAFLKSLKVGGRLFAIIGEAPVMEAVLITRIAENEWQREALFETETDPMIGAEQPRAFTF